MVSARLSLALSGARTVVNSLSKQRTPADASSVRGIVREGALGLTGAHAARFADFVAWKQPGLAPTLPYALLTHLHFSLVNDARFPFPPLGLIHKTETIEVLAPLRLGAWRMRCELSSITAVERGFELSIVSELTIDGLLSWRSTTLAFRRTRSGQRTGGKPRPAAPNLDAAERWVLPDGQGRRYGLLTNNVDPIHMSDWSARLMGHRSALMHGMWLAGRGLSSCPAPAVPWKVEFRFLSPAFLPTTVAFLRTGEGFALYSTDGHITHLLARF